MAQYEMNIRDYWLIVRRRRMTIVVFIAWSLAVIGVAARLYGFGAP